MTRIDPIEYLAVALFFQQTAYQEGSVIPHARCVFARLCSFAALEGDLGLDPQTKPTGGIDFRRELHAQPTRGAPARAKANRPPYPSRKPPRRHNFQLLLLFQAV